MTKEQHSTITELLQREGFYLSVNWENNISATKTLRTGTTICVNVHRVKTDQKLGVLYRFLVSVDTPATTIPYFYKEVNHRVESGDVDECINFLKGVLISPLLCEHNHTEQASIAWREPIHQPLDKVGPDKVIVETLSCEVCLKCGSYLLGKDWLIYRRR